MKPEREEYQKNVSDFIQKLQNSIIISIGYDIDSNPTYDKESIPFKFKYCYSVKINTSSGNFSLRTSQTEKGFDSFWLEEVQGNNFSFDQIINEKVESARFVNSNDDYPFKIEIDFENKTLFFYSGEIYDTFQEKLDFRINDEMILIFENKNDAESFEKNINYS